MDLRGAPLALLICLGAVGSSACSTTPQNPGVPTGGADGALDGAEADTWVPPPVAMAIAVGGAHVCALMSDDAIKCWGDNSHGQLGRDLPPSGTDADHMAVPEVTSDLDAPVGLLAGWMQTCALHGGGKASCWGANDKGQLGNGKDALVYGVDQLAAELGPDAVLDTGGIKAFAIGQTHGCVIDNSKRARCWGGNEFGQLGTNTGMNSRKPDHVKMAAGAVGIAAAAAHSCAVMASGEVYCWGKGADGRIGNGADDDAPSARKVTDLADAEALVAGAAHTCALRAEGKVSCWGAGDKGQLGDGGGKSSNTPVEVSGLSGVTLLAAGSEHTCALVADALHCWGANDSGQLGGSGGSGSATPLAVSGLGGVKTVAAGGGTTCAQVVDDGVLCWGDNGAGQLGAGTDKASSEAPVAIVFPEPVVLEPDAAPTDAGGGDVMTPDAGDGEDGGFVDAGPPVDVPDGGGGAPPGLVWTASGSSGPTVMVANGQGGDMATLWPGGQVVGPPGGGRILYFLSKSKELMVSKVDGSQAIIVAGAIMEPTGHGALSPDGAKVAYLKGSGPGSRQLALGYISPGGTEAGKLADDVARDSATAFSPGGSQVAWYGASGTLMVTATGLSNPKPLHAEALPFGTPALRSSLGWAPDGERVVFTVRRQQGDGPVSSDIAIIDSDGANFVLLTDDDFIDAELAVGKDGTVWFQRLTSPEKSSEIWRVGVNAMGLQKAANLGAGLNRLPQPSPGGDRLLYLASTGFGAGALTILQADSGKPTVVSESALDGFWR